jgi:hypothetical protein
LLVSSLQTGCNCPCGSRAYHALISSKSRGHGIVAWNLYLHCLCVFEKSTTCYLAQIRTNAGCTVCPFYDCVKPYQPTLPCTCGASSRISQKPHSVNLYIDALKRGSRLSNYRASGICTKEKCDRTDPHQYQFIRPRAIRTASLSRCLVVEYSIVE